MHRLRQLLRGPLAAWVVVWAGLVAGVNVAPNTALRLGGPGSWEAPTSDDLHLLTPFPGQPLIAEVPGPRSEVTPAPQSPHPALATSGVTDRHPSQVGTPPEKPPTEVSGVNGLERCRMLCTYRL